MTKASASNKLIDIGEVIQNGVVFNLRNWQDASVDMQNLPQTVERLFKLLDERKIDYVLVGGVAMLQYVEGRNTQDIDLIVSAEALNQLPEFELLGQEPDFARGRFAGVRVDLLFTSHPLFNHVRQSYSEVQPFKNRKIRCATVEGMLLLKFYALPSLYRQGRLDRVAIYEGDITMLMRALAKPVDSLLEVLQKHLSDSDLKELRKIAGELRQQPTRFDDGVNSK